MGWEAENKRPPGLYQPTRERERERGSILCSMYVLKRVDGRSVGSWGSLYLFHPYCSMRTDIRIRLTILFFSKKKKEREKKRQDNYWHPTLLSGGTAILDWKRSREGKHSLQGKGLLLSLLSIQVHSKAILNLRYQPFLSRQHLNVYKSLHIEARKHLFCTFSLLLYNFYLRDKVFMHRREGNC